MKTLLLVCTVLVMVVNFDVDPLIANEGCESANEKRTVTELGKRRTQQVALRVNKIEPIPASIRPNEVRHLRLRVRIESSASSNWIATIYDSALHVIQVLTPKDFANKAFTWTRRIPGGLAQIKVLAAPNSGMDPKLYIDSVVSMSDSVRSPFYSRQVPGQSAWKPLYRQDVEPRYRQWGDDVGILVSGHGEDNWVCSGVMVSPTLFLTNWHCGGNADHLLQSADSWLDDICPNTLIDLSWDDDPINRDFVCTQVEFANRDVDAVLLRVQPIDNQDMPRGVRLANPILKQYDNLAIIHHPLGEKKQISLDHCVVQTASRPSNKGLGAAEFTHTCDTESGSSGAPIFNSSGLLVGIHHLGFEVGENGICDNVNKAILLEAIVSKIKLVNLTLWEEISGQPRPNGHPTSAAAQ